MNTKSYKIFKSILSVILTLTIIVPNIIPSHTMLITSYACTDEDENYDAYFELEHTLMSKAGNWREAFKVDHIWSSLFHDEILNYIVERSNRLFGKELPISFPTPVINPTTGKLTSSGRADIYLKEGELTYLWEVKPASFLDDTLYGKRTQGEQQLQNYVDSNINFRNGKDYPNATPYIYLTGTFNVLTPSGAVYEVDFLPSGNGLIIYKFRKIQAAKIPVPVPQKDRQEAENGAYEYDEEPVNLEDEEPFEAKKRRSRGYFPSPAEKLAYATQFALSTTLRLIGGSIFEIDKSGNLVQEIVTSNNLHKAIAVATEILAMCEAGKYYLKDAEEAEYIASSFIAACAIGPNDDASNLLMLYNDIWNYSSDDPGYDGGDEDDDDNNSGNEDMKGHEDDYKAAEEQPATRDPLAIHLNSGERIEITSNDDGVYFDLDTNGFAEKAAWLGTEDGFLALDVNENGIIDDGSELFGDRFTMPDGNMSATGFEALLSLDDNSDSIIDSNDACFGSLMIWIDADHNGITGSNELKTLTELGITAFDLRNIAHEEVHYDGMAVEAESAKTVFIDGSERKISEFLLPVHSADTMHNGAYTNGNVLNIDQALYEDESGELAELCFRFCLADTVEVKKYYLKKIMYKMTGSENIEKDSRGPNIDARDLHVIEQFMGHEFNSVSGSVPNGLAADLLKALYNSIESIYYNYLIIQFNGSDLRTYVTVQRDNEGNVTINTALLEYILDICIDNGTDVEVCLYDFGKYLKYLDKKHGTEAYTAFKDKYSAVSQKYEKLFSDMDTTITIFGTDADEEINGAYSNEIIYGGKGDDLLNGGYGDDTYIFNLGDGNDTINEYNTSSSSDRIVFGEGISADDIRIDRDNYDMILSVGDNGDSIRIIDFFDRRWGYDYRIESFIFADGTEKTMSDYENASLTITGSGIIKDYNDFGNHDSTLIGSDEDDEIYGYAGNDTIVGGKGNDTLYGGSGNDTYIFNLGDGNNTISEESTSSSSDKIIFGEGITVDDIAISRENDDIIIHVGDNGDSIRINDFYYRAWGNDYRVENFVFADGTEKTSGYLESIPLTITGSGVIKDFTSGAGVKNSTLIGSDDNDEIYGYEGNDTLIGGKGNDTLYGGSGNDTYIFNLGDGNDTIDEYNTSSSSDRIVFGEGITVEDITISRENDDIIIHIGDNGDSIRICDFYYRAWGNDYRVEVFEFTDGNVSSIDCVQILNLNEFLQAA